MTMEPLFPTVNRELFGLLASWGSLAIGWFLADGVKSLVEGSLDIISMIVS